MAFLVSVVITISVLTCLQAVAAEGVDAQVGRYKHDQLLNNVVLIHAANGSTWSADGFGLIFGRAGHVVWVATPAHLLFPDYDIKHQVELEPAASIEVMRRTSTVRWPSAQPPELTGVSDLALLPVWMPLSEIGADLWSQSVIERDPRVGDSVHLTGYQRTISFDSDGGTIASVNSAGVPELAGLRGGEGQSGAPIATDRGFIGIYTQSIGQRFIPIQQVREAVLDANRPWKLTDAPVRAELTRLCFEVQGVQRETVRVAGPSKVVGLDEAGCAETHSGLNKLSTTVLGVVCSPDRIDLPAAGTDPVAIDCRTSPEGVWSGKDGFLSVKRAGEGTWQIEESLHKSHYGWIVGTLKGIPPLMFLEGRTQLGLTMTGQLRLEPRHLFGEVLVGGESWNWDCFR